MSGNSRISIGSITQGNKKGAGMESALSSALISATPLPVSDNKRAKK